MADPIAILDELTARLEWTLDAGEEAVATGALEDLSDDARYYGSQSWTALTAPRQVKSLILRAATRYMRNPDGFITSRAGDETVTWTDQHENAGSPHFTDHEQKMLASLANKSRITSVPIAAWGPLSRRIDLPSYVPVDPANEKQFPLFSDPVSPW